MKNGKSTPKWTLSTGLALFVAFCATHTVWTTSKVSYDATPDTDLAFKWVQKNNPLDWPDSMRIAAGLEKYKTFSDAARAYWTGPWASEPRSGFYRPMTSTLWWLMYHNWGANALAPFMFVMAASHIAATLLLFAFLAYLFRSVTAGALGASAFTLGLAYPAFKLAKPHFALNWWVDQPEMWVSLPYIAAVFCFTKYLREGSRWLHGSIAFFILGITFKEMAYSLPLILIALLWFENRLKEWRVLIPYGVVAFIALIIRTLAVGGTGTHFGSNGAWMKRALMEIGGGEPAALLLRYEGLPFCVAGVLLVMLALLFGARRFVFLGAAVAACGTMLAVVRSADMDDPFFYPLLGSVQGWYGGLMVLAWLACLWFAIVPVTDSYTRSQRIFRFGWLWSLATYIVLMATTTTAHALYLVSMGWGICFAGITTCMLDWIVHRSEQYVGHYVCVTPSPDELSMKNLLRSAEQK